MADIMIRNLDDGVASTLLHMAKKKKMSREEFLRRQLESLAAAEEIEAVENKYQSLVNALIGKLNVTDEIIERNNLLIEDCMEQLAGMRSGHGEV